MIINKTKKIKIITVQPKLLICGKVALVGNSDILNRSKFGHIIDKFADVIRFNFADINSQHTGHKTTIRWFGCPIEIKSAIVHNKNIDNEEKFKEYTIKLTDDVNIVGSQVTVSKLRKLNKDGKYYVNNKEVFNTFDKVNNFLEILGIKQKFKTDINNCFVRTGFLAILICLKSKCEPHLFGFDMTHRKVIRHYGTNYIYNVSKIDYHQITQEIKILQEMATKKLVYIH
jgi:hypothetical protein